ncbi:hypothetical protein [Actinomadura sp. NBRC 104425]|nr:hypothetical protein [Actinomadura sp. NBRC 104425]
MAILRAPARRLGHVASRAEVPPARPTGMRWRGPWRGVRRRAEAL